VLASQVDFTSIVANIRNTSKAMTRLILGIVVSFVGIMLTFPSSAPIYPAQNSLPRFLQGQIFFFTANAFMLGIVFHIVAYMRFGGRKQSSHQNISSELTSEFRSSESWADEDKGDNTKRKSERVRFASQPELSDGTKNFQDLRKHSSLPSAGAQPFVPIILTTLQPRSKSGRNSSHQSAAAQKANRAVSTETNDESLPQGRRAKSRRGCRVSGRSVMDMGDGVLTDVDWKTLSSKAQRMLSKGSHAFVKCYGERHLRCAWHTFDFGFAGGHSLLAGSNMVLMSGEIEVSGSGRITRWLMSQCGQAMPPRWAVNQSGLPITSAWAFIAGSEVDALPRDYSKEFLIAEGILEQLKETAPTTNSPRGEVPYPSPAWSKRDESDDLPSGVTRHGVKGSEGENKNSYGPSSPPRSVTEVRGVSIAPSHTLHTENTWVMKLGDDFDWDVSVSQSIYAAFREFLASHCTPTRSFKFRFQQLCPLKLRRHQVSPNPNDDHIQQQHRVRAGGSSGAPADGWGLDEVEEGLLVKFERPNKVAKDKEGFKDSTQARLEGGPVGIKDKTSQCRKVPLAPPAEASAP
jgi:hypothetical protein